MTKNSNETTVKQLSKPVTLCIIYFTQRNEDYAFIICN